MNDVDLARKAGSPGWDAEVHRRKGFLVASLAPDRAAAPVVPTMCPSRRRYSVPRCAVSVVGIGCVQTDVDFTRLERAAIGVQA